MLDRTCPLNVEVLETSPPTVRLSGEADFHSKHRISEAFDDLLERGHAVIWADLSDLAYVDSSGLSALVGSAAKAGSVGGAVELLGVSDRVSRLLTLCGAAAFFRARTPGVPVAGELGVMSPAEGYWHVSDFTLPATPAAAAIARSRIADVVRELPLSLSDGHDVLLAAGEALANAIKHGCGCYPDKHISVRCVAGPGRLAVDVTDSGPGFDPAILTPPSPHTLIHGGMGIYVMRELMDEVHFAFDGGTTVRLVKYMDSAVVNSPVDTG